MATIKFTVDKTSTGFDAYYEKNDTIAAITTGDTLSELKENALEAYNLYAEHTKAKAASIDQIVFEFDLPSFFEYYPMINARGLSARIGINHTLLSQYVNGAKKPSSKQVSRILTEVKMIGKELSELELV